jgi:N-acyl homoserine lactone hydrolase
VRWELIRTGSVPLAPGYLHRSEPGGTLAALGRGVPAQDMVRVPIGAVLLHHPVEGPVLVDTGLHPVVATDPARTFGRLGAAVARGLRAGPDENVPARLRALGLSPDDVRLVVMTHLHPDHTSAMSAFPRARFVVAREEWEAATGRLALTRGYLRGHLPPASAVRLVEPGEWRPWEAFARTLDLLGDGTIRLVATPGHTAGHLSVLFAGDDGPVLYLADAVYTLRNLREDVLPWRTADDEASRRSLAEIRAYAEAHPDVPLVPTHDPKVWDRLA